MSVLAPIEARFALRYPGFELDVDLRLPDGGVSALFGPSGSGKTSCLRCFAGLEPGCQGRVVVAGEVWQDSADGCFVPPHRRPFGFVFQDARLFTHLTVRGNLRYAMRRAVGPETVRFDEAVQLLGIADLLERRTDRLSGGERQRCAIARALLTRPRLLLLDEPLAGLSRAGRAQMVAFIRDRLRPLGVTLLFTEHDTEAVMQLADCIMVLQRGRALAEGPPDHIRGNPAVLDAYLGREA